ncbi:MAG: hypothetical protein EOO47_28045 [Flavobacterium sp.]|nr:MAG: hypothetical protein EOO47_28045 [Flavobacterium sp.]
MKTFLKTTILLFIIAIINSCSKDDDKGVESLPPATQTGARTFGCLVDGNAFIDTGAINCFYQYVDGGYYFAVGGENNSENPIGVNIATYNKTISQGETLPLTLRQDGYAWGGAFFELTSTNGESGFTNNEYTGEVTITKLDYESNIVSGTFWLDVKHPETGARIKITDGRFDTHFSQ